MSFITEPLAFAFWVALFVFLVTWGWAGERYSTRATRRERREWKDAIRWANKVQAYKSIPQYWTEEDWERAKVQAREILLGNTSYITQNL